MENLNLVQNNQPESISIIPDFYKLEFKILKVESLCVNFSKLIGSMDKPEQIIKNLLNSEPEINKMENYFEARQLRNEISYLATMGHVVNDLMNEITSELMVFEQMVNDAEEKILSKNSEKKVA